MIWICSCPIKSNYYKSQWIKWNIWTWVFIRKVESLNYTCWLHGVHFSLNKGWDLFYVFISTLFFSSPKLWRGRFWEGSWTLQKSCGNKRSRDFVDRWKSNFSTLIKWRYVQYKKCIITKYLPGTWTKVI